MHVVDWAGMEHVDGAEDSEKHAVVVAEQSVDEVGGKWELGLGVESAVVPPGEAVGIVVEADAEAGMGQVKVVNTEVDLGDMDLAWRPRLRQD